MLALGCPQTGGQFRRLPCGVWPNSQNSLAPSAQLKTCKIVRLINRVAVAISRAISRKLAVPETPSVARVNYLTRG
jgi:hypothetical protein